MENIPKLSVLMTSYNDGKYIPCCLDSILNQTFQDFEIIIVDDASKDNTVEVIRSYQEKYPKINLICNKKNMGLAKSLNKGLQYCRADLIARQDSDDYSVLTRFEEQLNYLDNYPDVALLGTQEIRIDENNNEMEAPWYPTEYEDIKHTMLQSNCFNHASVVFKKNVILKIGGYRPFPECEDYELWIRLIQNHTAGNLKNRLVYRRILRKSVSFRRIEIQTSSSSLSRMLAKQRFDHGCDELDGLAGEELERKIWNLLRKEFKVNKKLCGSKNVHYFIYVLKISGKRDALVYLLRALKFDPLNPYIIRLFIETYISKKLMDTLSKIKKNFLQKK